MVAAYELERAGYSVEILEASHRVGGRVLTLRHGDVVDEIGNRQVCQFDEDPNLLAGVRLSLGPWQLNMNFADELASFKAAANHVL